MEVFDHPGRRESEEFFLLYQTLMRLSNEWHPSIVDTLGTGKMPYIQWFPSIVETLGT